MRLTKVQRTVWVPLAIHVVITVVVMVVGTVAVPHWYIQSQLKKLTSSSIQDREEGLNFVIHTAGAKPSILRATIEYLDVPDDTNFLQIVNALDLVGQWRRPAIPDTAWLRWLDLASKDTVPESRSNVARYLADLPDLATDPQVLGLIKRLLEDADAEVRYQTLVTTAQLASVEEDRADYTDLLFQAGSDDNPEIARQAWLYLGWLQPAGAITSDWRSIPPRVAVAMLWAIPTSLTHCIEAVNDPSVDPGVRAMAAYGLHRNADKQAINTLNVLLQQYLQTSEIDGLTAWRAALALGHSGGKPNPALAGMLSNRLAESLNDTANKPYEDPVVLSALYTGLLSNADELKTLRQTGSATARSNPLATLAYLEGLPVGKHKITIAPNTPDMIRLAAVAVTKNPSLDDLRLLFEHEVATIRDLACVIAHDRFSTEQLDPLVESLLKDFNDNAKCSGAILAGLTGLQTLLLTKRAEYEDMWPIQQILKLGLWMQDRLPEMTALAPGLLSRNDLPTTTILLAMLHRKHPAAWEYLFDLRSESQVDLVELLDQHRWWRVLKRYLPTGSDPLVSPQDKLAFWFWADPELEEFQIDLIRSWYTINSHRFQGGDWQENNDSD